MPPVVDLTPVNPDTRRGPGQDRFEGVGLSEDGLEAALALFDQLEPVAPEELIGRWRGEGFPTGHPLDGVLEAWNWRGKRFESLEEVHPLVFAGPRGGEVFVDPSRVPMEVLRAGWVGWLAPLGSLSPWLVPMVSTRASAARLRGMCYRGKVSATMVYDALPIMDVFRRLDSERLLGLMDAKGLARPFFFVLRREGSAKA
jgi:GXWXG protein/Domain of unknown function (DUF4334)